MVFDSSFFFFCYVFFFSDKRHEGQVELRKQARSEQLQKRRHVVDDEDEPKVVLGESQGSNREAITLANLPEIVAAIKSNVAAQVYRGTKQCRILLSKEKNPPIAQASLFSFSPPTSIRGFVPMYYF